MTYTYNYLYAYNGSGNEYVNNSVVGSGTYGIGYGYYITNFSKIDHNNYYVYGGSTLAYWDGSYYSDLTALKGAAGPTGHNKNSRQGDPGYCEPELGDLTPVTTQLEDGGSLGMTGGTVLDDINMNSRPAVAGDSIDIGAHEFEPPNQDLAIKEMVTPIENGCYSSSESVTFRMENTGLGTWDFSTNGVVVVSKCDAGSTTTFSSYYLISGSLAPGEDTVFTVSSTFDMTTSGTYDFEAFHIVIYGTDELAKNDTFRSSMNVTAPVSGFPWTEDFETFTVNTVYSGNTADEGYDNGWFWDGGTDTDYPWTPENGSGYTYREWYYADPYGGTIKDHTYECTSTSGKFMMMECDAGGYPAYYEADHTLGLTSPCLNFDTLSCPQLEFFHHGYGYARGNLYVDVTPDGGATWDMAVYTIPAGWTHQSTLCTWTQHLVDLSDYAGKTGVRIRFRGERADMIYDGTYECYYGDQCIDDVTVSEKGADLAVGAVELPSACDYTSSEEITVTLCNNSCDTIKSSDYFVVWSSTGPVSGSSSLESGGDILPNDCITYTFTSTADFSSKGDYSVEVIAVYTGGVDDDPTNNTSTGNELGNYGGVVLTENAPYYEDFEADTGGWYAVAGTNANCATCTSSGSTAPSLWQWGTPSKSGIDTASSGTKVWMTDTAVGYGTDLNESVMSGCYDFSCVLEPELSVDINYLTYGSATYTYGGAIMEYSIDGGNTWTKLGDKGTGTNWYNTDYSYGFTTSAMFPSWGYNSGGWITAIHDLSFLKGQGQVHFRFRFASYSYSYSPNDGFAFDDFTITEKYFDQTTDDCPTSPTATTGDVYGTVSFNGEICCETTDATEDPATAPTCWSDGFDNSVYFPIRTSAATGKRTLNIFMNIGYNANGGKVQAALYGPFAPGACPAPSAFGTPVRCTESPGPFLALSGVLVTDPDEVYILVLDGEKGECAAMTITPFGTALPVELMNFEVSKVGHTAVLDWVTASETNNSYFAIERSVDGVEFEEIGTVSGNGTTSDASYYQFVDENPMSGINYYRLRQVDYDGSYEYSDIQWVEFVGTEGDITVYPNPFNSTLNVNLTAVEAGTVELQLTDVIGRVLLSQEIEVVDGVQTITLDLDDRMSKGVYMLNVQGAGYDEVIKVVKED